MNILAVDDEKPALSALVSALGKALPTADVHSFNYPEDALEFAADNQIDIAFLDIEMGSMNGLELARHLKDICGTTIIVFVTGYSKYAIDAFSVCASGYLLKPVSPEHITNVMQELGKPAKLPENGIYFQTFGGFNVLFNGTPVAFTLPDTKEALACFIHKKGTPVTRKELAQAIWPNQPYNRKIKKQLRAAITEGCRILKELGAADAICCKRDTNYIKPELIKCDLYQMLEWNIWAINKYQGSYMPEYPWAEISF